MSRARTVDELLDEARASLRRVSPIEAQRAAAAGALLVDIRRRNSVRTTGRFPAR